MSFSFVTLLLLGAPTPVLPGEPARHPAFLPDHAPDHLGRLPARPSAVPRLPSRRGRPLGCFWLDGEDDAEDGPVSKRRLNDTGIAVVEIQAPPGPRPTDFRPGAAAVPPPRSLLYRFCRLLI